MAHRIVIYPSLPLAVTRQILDDFVNQETGKSGSNFSLFV